MRYFIYVKIWYSNNIKYLMCGGRDRKQIENNNNTHVKQPIPKNDAAPDLNIISMESDGSL